MKPITCDISDAEGSEYTANFYAINLSKREAIRIGNLVADTDLKSMKNKKRLEWSLLWEALFECEAGNAKFILIRVGNNK